MIFNVIWTMFLFRGASSALGNLPYESGAFVSIGLGNLLDGATAPWSSSRASACSCTSG